MLEILFDVNTSIIRAWNADEASQGEFNPEPEQAVVIFPIDPPTFESDWYKVDLVNQTVVGNPDYQPYSDDYIRACELLEQSPDVITQPEQWELLRIFARRLGYDF